MIDTQQIAVYFSLVEKHVGKNDMLSVLQQQFIQGANDDLFFNRLKVFAAQVFKNK